MQPDSNKGNFAPFADKMKAENLPDIAIRTFRHYYSELLAGETGYIPGEQARPVSDLPDSATLSPHYSAAGRVALEEMIVIKLNGGLGTSMGMTGPKSLLPLKNDLTFIDIVARQILHLRKEHGARVPLVLMNSFNTRAQSLQALERYPNIESDVPLDFVQHKIPKIWQSDLSPVEWPADREKEWCPPGHGDIYPSLVSSGMLKELLEQGYHYAFVSNIDNLGATVDLSILGFFAENNLPFLMEVTERTPADRKGGHLARDPDGGLLLREIAQCPPDEVDAFQDIRRYRYFNTNNLWLHLPTLHRVMEENNGLLKLPMIVNRKHVDPTQPDSPDVYQLETAMGLAISSVDGAEAIRVTRERFRPVKRCTDLLALWSDAYHLTDDYRLLLVPERDEDPLVELDDRYYRLIEEMTERFPYGAPSLRSCSRLQVEGDVQFGDDVTIRGDVKVLNHSEQRKKLADGAVLTDEEVRL